MEQTARGGRNEVKEAQAISPPQLLKVTGATAEKASDLLFWAEGAEKERRGNPIAHNREWPVTNSNA